VGRIPVASYPTFAAAPSVRGALAWVAAYGTGVGPNLNGPNPTSPLDSNNQIIHFQYLPMIIRGDAGILEFPSDHQIRRLTPVADRELIPTDAESPPAGTPIRSGGPIKHVFFIVKENRTYDQVFGDVKAGDGDARLTLFGSNITPNMHALVARFPLLDHVYADSLASVEGHYWTDSGTVPPYVIRNWPQSNLYASRGRPLDFGLTEAAQAAEGSIFDRAVSGGISFYNYGEVIGAGLAAPLADKDRTAAERAQEQQVLDGSDVALLAAARPTRVGRRWRRVTRTRRSRSSRPMGRTPTTSTPRCPRGHRPAHARAISAGFSASSSRSPTMPSPMSTT
jgi:hypothetical protein